MDKQAFKQRMQNLKSYRENNPGKGYWDWKVEAFQDGGEVTRKSLRDIRKESTIEGKLDYDDYFSYEELKIYFDRILEEYYLNTNE